ncbi:restriction endonuclease [bacterium]|nr:restriction endonuclease [bacterium]
MYVIKASGEKQKFSPRKIRRTCLRAGAGKRLASQVVKEIEKKAYNGIKTSEILDLILKYLGKKKSSVAIRYSLKRAIFRLGPAGFPFEKFMAEVLRYYGYKTSLNKVIRGKCVNHEIDIIAEKQNGKKTTYMIECKYHNAPGIYTGLKETLYTWSRFLDLKDGYQLNLCKKFDIPWMISNTKFSSDALEYAQCKKMKLLGWHYPKTECLEDLIENKKLYPITILQNLDRYLEKKFIQAKIVLCQDLVNYDIKYLHSLTGIKEKILKIFINQAREIIKD